MSPPGALITAEEAARVRAAVAAGARGVVLRQLHAMGPSVAFQVLIGSCDTTGAAELPDDPLTNPRAALRPSSCLLAMQEEALMTAAVLCHSGEGVPSDEAAWRVLQEAMRVHPGSAGVQLVRNKTFGCLFARGE